MRIENFDFVLPAISPLMFALLSIGVALNIVIYCKRRLADLLVYHELVIFLAYGFVPCDYGNHSHVVLLAQVLLVFLCYATNV